MEKELFYSTIEMFIDWYDEEKITKEELINGIIKEVEINYD